MYQKYHAMNILFLGTQEDKSYLPHLKPFFRGRTVFIILAPIDTLTQLELYCAKNNVKSIISTDTHLLQKLLQINTKPSLNNYSGSLFSHKNLEILFISPLSQLFTVSYGQFITERFISKITAPEKWFKTIPFSWEILSPTNIESYYTQFKSALFIAVDIETFKDPLAIRCCGYTAVWKDSTSKSIVLPLDSEWALSWLRKFNSLPAPKITQNGKYDNSYLLRYQSPLYNWIWDTAHLFHSWYSELPKDLGFLNAFCLRDTIYWKDLANTNDLYEYYKYNCLDHWTTANVFLAMMQEYPEYAARNYVLEFPLVFPCLLAEMIGIKVNSARLEIAQKEQEEKQNTLQASLEKMIGVSNFNVLSNPQMQKLLTILDCGDIARVSCNEKHLEKARFRHPLNARILQTVLDIRGIRKLRSTYLVEKDFNGRILYALNPHGTDTGRLASREHHFWCGLQIQNVPRGKEVKQIFVADEGFLFGKADLEQAESRDTAHISGDEKLIAAVSGTKDFHSINAAAFFGIPYEDLWDDTKGKTKNKPIRDLAKRVNHGANYNMGAAVLVDTMGLEKIFTAAKLLNLPKFWSAIQIAEHLLVCFHKTYPNLKGVYYPAIISEVLTTGFIVSRAYHTGQNEREYIEKGDWTRRCFGRPDKNKSDLNALVAHPPQSLNARTLNEAWLKVFYELAIPHHKNFKLVAQIHDEIFFMYREGYEHLAHRVKELMEIPVTVRDVKGVYRTFTVPAALKIGAKYWSELE